MRAIVFAALAIVYTVTLTDLGQVLGPYAVTRGGSGPENLCLAPQQP